MNALQLKVDALPEMRPTNLRKLQEQDPIIGSAKKFLKGELDPQSEYFNRFQNDAGGIKLSNNLILFRTRKDPDIFRIWIPAAITEKLITFMHESYGHFGGHKIVQLISAFAYWRNMARQTRVQVAKCVICQKTKFPNRHYEGPMHHIIPTAPNELVCLDLFGPMPTARYGFKHALVIIDAFSKFTQIYPITRPTARNCLNPLIQRYFKTAGQSKRVLSDHATQFTSHLWSTTLNDLGVKAIFSSIRHPQSNISERCMRELARIFRVYVSECHKAWPEVLPYINKWVNYIPHDSTKMAPFEVHFGKKPPSEFPLLARLATHDTPDYEERCRIVYENMVLAAERRKKKVKKPYHFNIGDRVLLRTPQVSDQGAGIFHKFLNLFSGPFTITDIPHPNVAKLIDGSQSPAGKYNFFNLIPFKE